MRGLAACRGSEVRGEDGVGEAGTQLLGHDLLLTTVNQFPPPTPSLQPATLSLLILSNTRLGQY